MLRRLFIKHHIFHFKGNSEIIDKKFDLKIRNLLLHGKYTHFLRTISLDHGKDRPRFISVNFRADQILFSISSTLL